MENSAQINLEMLSNVIAETETGSKAGVVYRSFADAFIKIREMAVSERLVFAIDEYPYLAKSEPGISSAEAKSAVIGSCKFRNEKLPFSELQLMQEYARIMGGFEQYYYFFFSKSGFADALRQEQNERKLRLVTLDEMYRVS